MTEDEREQFYDDEIAPALLDLCTRCNDNGISFIAVAEWAPGNTGRTRQFVEPFSPVMDWANAAARCGGNVDALIGYLVDSAKAVGHSSVYLKMLGVPLSPAENHIGAPS